MTSPDAIRVAAITAVLLASACGARANDDIPPGLLEAISASEQGNADYPQGPYGTDVGDTARDVCVEGWRDPAPW